MTVPMKTRLKIVNVDVRNDYSDEQKKIAASAPS